MNDDEANKAKRATILRYAAEKLREALVDSEGEQREAILKLIAYAEVALTRLDKRHLH
jgi:hypothetical protein